MTCPQRSDKAADLSEHKHQPQGPRQKCPTCGDKVTDQPRQRSLPALVQSLPAELFQLVYDLTFTTPSNEIRYVSFFSSDGEENSGTYHAALRLLQVDRASRAKFSTSYHGVGRFILAEWDRCHADHHGNAWLMSLSRQDRRRLRRFEYVLEMHPSDPSGDSESQRLRARREAFGELVWGLKPRPHFCEDEEDGRIQVVFDDDLDS